MLYPLLFPQNESRLFDLLSGTYVTIDPAVYENIHHDPVFIGMLQDLHNMLEWWTSPLTFSFILWIQTVPHTSQQIVSQFYEEKPAVSDTTKQEYENIKTAMMERQLIRHLLKKKNE